MNEWMYRRIIEVPILYNSLKYVPMYLLKLTYSEKATKYCEISTLLLSYVVPVKSKVKILQKFVAFSEYINFNSQLNQRISKIPSKQKSGMNWNYGSMSCQVSK